MNVTPLIARVRHALEPRSLWSFGLIEGHGGWPPRVPSSLKEVKLFNSRRLRLGISQDHPHTQADPFLIVREDRLYVFYETMRPGRQGEITACSTADLQQFEDHGVILSERHHLSFPFVFELDGAAYLLPEASKGDGLWLYRFQRFPFGPARVRRLTDRTVVDSFLHFHRARWYLFASEGSRLILMVGGATLDEPFVEHPASPICTDPRFSRSGGAMWQGEGKLFRPAQDCSTKYGANLSWIEILDLSPVDYAERVETQDIVELARSWNFDGAHHLSTVHFQGKTIIAIDGRHHDYWINRLARVIPGAGRFM